MNKRIYTLKGSKATASSQKAGSGSLKKTCKTYKREVRQIMISALPYCVKPNPNNRGGDINWDRVHMIAKSIVEEGTEYLVMPIIADMTTHIMTDGGHTYYALREVLEEYGFDFPVMVIYVEYPAKKSIDVVTAEINNDRNGWELENFINLQILQGNKNYINLKKMAEEVGGAFIKKGNKEKIRWRYLSSLCGHSCQQELREGTYQLSDKQMSEQIELGNMINNLLNKAGVTQIAAWLESFILAFVKGITQYNARGMKNYYTSVYNRIDTIVFDGSQSTCVWAERLSGMDKAA